jgi:hypothetical protein
VARYNRYGSYGYRSGYSGGTASSKTTTGDIVFMSKGVARIILREVNDPGGVLWLAKAVKSASLPKVTKVKPQPPVTTSNPNLVNASSSKSQVNKGQIVHPQGISRSEAECPKCHSLSPFGSNYCTRCGFMLK